MVLTKVVPYDIHILYIYAANPSSNYMILLLIVCNVSVIELTMLQGHHC